MLAGGFARLSGGYRHGLRLGRLDLLEGQLLKEDAKRTAYGGVSHAQRIPSKIPIFDSLARDQEGAAPAQPPAARRWLAYARTARSFDSLARQGGKRLHRWNASRGPTQYWTQDWIATELSRSAGARGSLETPPGRDVCARYFMQVPAIGWLKAHRWFSEGCRSFRDVLAQGTRAESGFQTTALQRRKIHGYMKEALVGEVEEAFACLGAPYEGWLYGFQDPEIGRPLRLEIGHPDFDADVPDELLGTDTTPLLRKMISLLKSSDIVQVDDLRVSDGGRHWLGWVCFKDEGILGFPVELNMISWSEFDHSDQ